MGLYLGVKVLWIATTVLLGEEPDGWNAGSWITLNAATALMALVGVVVGLALARDWGQRVPAVLVVPPLWLASGFLVTMLPYMVALPLLEAAGGGGSECSSGS